VIELFEGFGVAFWGFRHVGGTAVSWFWKLNNRVVASRARLGKRLVILLRCTAEHCSVSPAILLRESGLSMKCHDEQPGNPDQEMPPILRHRGR
jgi:hypothetical protein